MKTGNDIIHQQHRLRIMAALENDPTPLDFATLKAISGATDGNLGAHLQALEKAGYITLTKDAIGQRSRTWATITHQGRTAFHAHIAFLQEILGLGLSSGAR